MRIDWGTFPDWLAGSGAILAVVFAGIAARAAWVANQVQLKQLRRLERADELHRANEDREQASRVAVWIRMVESGTPGVVCFNGSGLPVYTLRISPVLAGENLLNAEVRYAVKGPDSSPKLLGYATERLREAFMDALADRENGNLSWSQLYESGDLSLTVRFIDSRGRAWCRSADGRLSEISDDR